LRDQKACPTVETERLLLRPFREDDVDAYAALLQTPEVRAALHLPAGVGRGEAWLGIAQTLGQWELRGTGQWALEEKASGAFVGRAGTHSPERADWPGIEVGWALHPDHWATASRPRPARPRSSMRSRTTTSTRSTA
jgi:[ribosomal protein S5]-alanine N-acetyltransferase